MLTRRAGSIPFGLAVAIVLVSFTLLGFPIISSNVDQLTGINFALDDGIEIIKSRSYEISTNLKWDEIKATGIKVTEKSWKGFLQTCERLIVDFGNVKIYLDLEIRVMFVYAEPTANESETEVYYVQFR